MVEIKQFLSLYFTCNETSLKTIKKNFCNPFIKTKIFKKTKKISDLSFVLSMFSILV